MSCVHPSDLVLHCPNVKGENTKISIFCFRAFVPMFENVSVYCAQNVGYNFEAQLDLPAKNGILKKSNWKKFIN